MNTSKFNLKIALITSYLFLGGILLVAAAPTPALAYNMDTRTGVHVNASLVSGAIVVQSSDIDPLATTTSVVISGCGADGNCNNGITNFHLLGTWHSGAGPWWSDFIAGLVGASGTTIYNSFIVNDSSYCSAGVCIGAIYSDAPLGSGPYDTNGGFPNFTQGSALPHILFSVDSSGVMSFTSSTNPDTTRIDSVIPPNDFAPNWPLARATSTTFAFGVSGNESTADFQAGDYVSVEASNNAQNSSIAAVAIFSGPQFTTDRFDKIYKFPITAAGTFIFSTSTDVEQIGVYSMNVQIHHKDSIWNSFLSAFSFLPGLGNGNPPLVSTSTQFLVATTTVFDAFQGNSSIPYLQAFNAATASSTCTNWGDPTQLSTCVNSLFVPNEQQSAQTYALFQSAILNRAPLGYISRFYSIVASSTNPVEPVALSYTFGSSSPSVLNGKSYSINIFDPNYLGTSSPLATVKTDDGQNKNIWGIIDPYFTTVVAIAVFLVILSDITGIQLQTDATQLTMGEQMKINRSYKKSSGQMRDDNGRTADERRKVINERGQDRDRRGGRGVVH